MIKTRKRRPDNLLPNVLGKLDKLAARIEANLQNLRRPTPILPADVGKQLVEAMLARQNGLEDARYFKVAPNDYLVELNEATYHRYYQPVEKLVCEQWRERLLEMLNTTNSRQGWKEYCFGGRVRIRIRPVTNLGGGEVRIHCRIKPEAGAAAAACLELVAGGQQWPLREEVTVIGRDEACDIFLNLPLVQQTRLMSGQH
ncbi:MAG: FhaA domain-containing protein, partial [Chloroflexota bacterium]